jgi:DNA replication protein DnaC
MGARRTAADPDRRRDHRPRSLQRPGPDETAAFPVIKTLEELDRSARSIPARPWTTSPASNGSGPKRICLVGPAGTGKSHVLVSLGVVAVHAGHKVRYFTAADLADTLYRGLADNSAGRVIENLLRNDLILLDEVGFAPLDNTGAQPLFRFVSAAYERRSLGLASHWPFDQCGRFLPEHTTAVSLLDRLLHDASVVVTAGDSYRMREARAKRATTLNKT